jgi:di/tricarboxylate transporter
MSAGASPSSRRSATVRSHQCNTLVMGTGGYRFGDYWHLGLPLSCLVVLLGAPLIALVLPLH